MFNIIFFISLFAYCFYIHDFLYLFLFIFIQLLRYKIFTFIYIKFFDFYTFLKDIKNNTYFRRIYGVYGYVGEYGQGKTICLVKEYLKLSKRTKFHNPDNYIFISNFNLKGTEHFNTLDDVLVYYRLAVSSRKGLIIFWDEAQNEFPENDRNFPPQLRVLLTQNRKNFGVRLLWSTQDYTRVNKNLRVQTIRISEMRCIAKRYMVESVYCRNLYEDYYNSVSVDNKVKKKALIKHRFIQTDLMRNMFGSFVMLESAKNILGISEIDKEFVTDEDHEQVEPGMGENQDQVRTRHR